jgi:hypothetical protein
VRSCCLASRCRDARFIPLPPTESRPKIVHLVPLFILPPQRMENLRERITFVIPRQIALCVSRKVHELARDPSRSIDLPRKLDDRCLRKPRPARHPAAADSVGGKGSILLIWQRRQTVVTSLHLDWGEIGDRLALAP